MKAAPEFDNSVLLASSIHEIKYSLNMLLNSIDEVVTTCSEETCPAYKIFPRIQYESKRVNDDLVELLAIYRIRNDQYSANIDEYSVLDFLNENIGQHEAMILHRKINYKMDCDHDLHWFFDRDLITGVISNVINNLYKYTKDKLHISAVKEEAYLVIKIKDNGPGYPEDMLIANDDNQKSISFDEASTGPGLYFSRLVAELHKNKGRKGYITTTNDGIEGGGCFSLYLP
ncbi:MAG: HAMP domain-containing sensor histidine kinase [Proteobacteria bacterium]|nr:HAMP domain-containing sensor histidine kinase [Pseudomonadota bacterium]